MLTSFFHPHIGGVERHVLNLSVELIRQGHSISIFTQHYHPSLQLEESIEKIKIIRIPKSLIPKTQTIRAWARLMGRLLLLLKADVIHVHDYSPFIAWYLPFRFLLFWKPVYATFHGYEGIFPVVKRNLWARKLVAGLTKGNICIGHYLEKWYGTKSDLITYGAVKRPDRDHPPEDQAIVFIGRLEPDTGIIDYLHTLALIQNGPGCFFKLYICGDGSLRETIQKIIANNSLKAELVGPVSDPLPWIQRGRFIFASGYLTILEAMICRRAVFSIYGNPLKSDYLKMIPGAEDMMMIADGPETLAQQFRDIRNDPAKEADMLEKAYRFAGPYTWKKLADDYLGLYQST